MRYYFYYYNFCYNNVITTMMLVVIIGIDLSVKSILIVFFSKQTGLFFCNNLDRLVNRIQLSNSF